MILLDANLLIYAHVSTLPQHRPARSWLEGQFSSGVRVGLPWPSLLAFLRIVTNPRVFERPEPLEQAFSRVREWLDLDTTWIPVPGERHAEILERFVPQASASPKLVPDAHLAALAVEHGLVLFSADLDFARFPGLRWENPLEA